MYIRILFIVCLGLISAHRRNFRSRETQCPTENVLERRADSSSVGNLVNTGSDREFDARTNPHGWALDPKVIISHIRGCSEAHEQMIKNAILEVVWMLDQARDRLNELAVHLSHRRGPPNKRRRPRLASTFRLYSTLIYRHIPTNGDPIEPSRQSSIDQVRKLSKRAHLLSRNIKDDLSEASNATEIYCNDRWMMRAFVKIDGRHEVLLLDTRRSISWYEQEKRQITSWYYFRPWEIPELNTTVPAVVDNDLAGPRTSVITLNPYFLRRWHAYYRKEYLPNLKTLSAMEIPWRVKLIPKFLTELSQVYAAPNLLLKFSMTPTVMHPLEPLQGTECEDETGQNLFACLTDMALYRPLEAVEDQVSFTYLVLGLYLSHKTDWSTGARDPVGHFVPELRVIPEETRTFKIPAKHPLRMEPTSLSRETVIAESSTHSSSQFHTEERPVESTSSSSSEDAEKTTHPDEQLQTPAQQGVAAQPTDFDDGGLD